MNTMQILLYVATLIFIGVQGTKLSNFELRKENIWGALKKIQSAGSVEKPETHKIFHPALVKLVPVIPHSSVRPTNVICRALKQFNPVTSVSSGVVSDRCLMGLTSGCLLLIFLCFHEA